MLIYMCIHTDTHTHICIYILNEHFKERHCTWSRINIKFNTSICMVQQIVQVKSGVLAVAPALKDSLQDFCRLFIVTGLKEDPDCKFLLH